jgi:hypothetical protein
MAADFVVLHGCYALLSPCNGVESCLREDLVAAILLLLCWISAILFFFGAKILEVYGILLSVVTHFRPLWPFVLIAGIVALIVAAAPKRVVD